MKRMLSMSLAVCLIGASLAGCGQKPAETTPAPAAQSTAAAAGNGETGAAPGAPASGEPILIGVSNMVTGPMAAGGLRMKQSITMAFEEINANGGVLGRPLEMVLVDDTGTPTGAVNSVNRILGSKVTACIGPHTSPMVAAVSDIYSKNEIPFVSGATSPKLIDAKNPYFFRISVSDGSVGQVMVKFAGEKFGAKKIAALYDTDDYGVAANATTEAYCKANGFEYYSEGFTGGDKDLTSQLMKLKAWGPDVVFSYSHDAEVALHVRQMNELGMKDIPFIGPNALPMPQVLDLVEGSQVDGCYASTDYFGDTTDPVMSEFLTKFKDRWGEDAERYAALYYSASYLLADAIERAGSDDPKAVRDALAATADFQSVMGTLNCNEDGELNTNIFILQMDGEKNVSVAEKVSLDK